MKPKKLSAELKEQARQLDCMDEDGLVKFARGVLELIDKYAALEDENREASEELARSDYALRRAVEERDSALARVAKLEEVLRDIGKWYPKAGTFGGVAAQLASLAREALASK